MGNPAHLDPGSAGHVGDIPGGGIPFNGGVGGQDQLADGLRLQTPLQDLQPQLLGADAIEGGQVPHQHEVTAGELARVLDGSHVRRALHHTQQAALFALGIGADLAKRILGEGAAVAAVAYLGQRPIEQLGQTQAAAALALEQGKGHALGRLGADTRQHLQGLHHLIQQGAEFHGLSIL